MLSVKFFIVMLSVVAPSILVLVVVQAPGACIIKLITAVIYGFL